MEWTRESRYKKYSEWDAETLLKLQAQATASKYQMDKIDRKHGTHH